MLCCCYSSACGSVTYSGCTPPLTFVIGNSLQFSHDWFLGGCYSSVVLALDIYTFFNAKIKKFYSSRRNSREKVLFVWLINELFVCVALETTVFELCFKLHLWPVLGISSELFTIPQIQSGHKPNLLTSLGYIDCSMRNKNCAYCKNAKVAYL